MRQIYIVSPVVSRRIIVYDGLRTENHRREYETLDDFSEKGVSELKLNPKKQVRVYLEGFNGEKQETERVLSEVLPKARFD